MPVVSPDEGIAARREAHQLRPQSQDVYRVTDEDLQLLTGDLQMLP